MQLGYSASAARSMEAMTKLTLDDKHSKLPSPICGATTLTEYGKNLVVQKNKSLDSK